MWASRSAAVSSLRPLPSMENTLSASVIAARRARSFLEDQFRGRFVGWADGCFGDAIFCCDMVGAGQRASTLSRYSVDTLYYSKVGT